MRLLNRILKLEAKQPKKHTYFPIDWFYGRDAQPVPLIRNQTLAGFYTSTKNRLVNEVFCGKR